MLSTLQRSNRRWRSICQSGIRDFSSTFLNGSCRKHLLQQDSLHDNKKYRSFKHEISALLQQSRGVKITGSDVKAGHIIERKGRLLQVLKTQHTVQGRGGATIQVELRDLQNGIKLVERLRTSEAVEKAYVEEKKYTYLYEDGNNAVLMESETFEQLEVPKTLFGNGASYLVDGMQVSVNIYDSNPISASVPSRVTCTVSQAESYIRGQTETPSYKKIVLDNGVQTMAPPFVAIGDKVTVDTSDNAYVTRVK